MTRTFLTPAPGGSGQLNEGKKMNASFSSYHVGKSGHGKKFTGKYNVTICDNDGHYDHYLIPFGRRRAFRRWVRSLDDSVTKSGNEYTVDFS